MHPTQKTIVLTLIVLVVLLVLSQLPRFFGLSTAVSPMILSLTQPIYTIDGVVKSVSGQSIQFEYTPVNLPGTNLSPTPANKAIVFTATVDNNTKITKMVLPIPYRLKGTIGSSSVQAHLSAVQPNDKVTVTSATDLRTLQQPAFKAKTIAILPILNSISGTVTGTTADSVTVRDTQHIANQQNASTYTFKVNSDTEISGFRPAQGSTPTGIKFALSDLKKDMSVNIFTNQSLSSNDLTALMIDLPPETAGGTPTAPVPQATSSNGVARPLSDTEMSKLTATPVPHQK